MFGLTIPFPCGWKCWSSTTYKRAIPYGCKYRVNTGAWITVPLGGLAANAISLSTGDVLEIKIPNAPIYDASTSLPI